MYVVTGNDDVFALNAKTGEIIWEYWSGIDQTISTVCCGWANRGLAMGEGQIYLGQLDANVVALDMKTGKVAWKTPIEKWQNGYGITSAPLYYDGMIYSGITGGEFGVRGRLTALNAKTGEIMWRWFTLPGPGEKGSETWPPGTDHAMRGGAAIWNTPALDPELGLVYFAVGNCGPDYDGSMREGDNLFCTSIVALKAKTGEYAWHFQQVHHDIWDYDAASPVVLFDTVINGEPRKGIAEAGRTGWSTSSTVSMENRWSASRRSRCRRTRGRRRRRRSRFQSAMRPCRSAQRRFRATTRPVASTPRSGNPRS
jgi:quinohemoprotein ethanol dehydrogenase